MQPRQVVRLSPSQILTSIGQEDIDYQLNAAPFTRYWWTGLAFEAVGAGESSTGIFIGPYAWDARPTSGLTVGDTFRASDVGASPGTMFMWTGSRWRHLHPFAVKEIVGTVAAPIATLSGVTAGAFTLPSVVSSFADMFTTGDRLTLEAMVFRTGSTATNDVNMFFGTAGTTSDAQVISANMTAIGLRNTHQCVDLLVTSATTFVTLGNTPVNGSATNQFSDQTTNVNFAAVMQATVAIAAANAADSFNLVAVSLRAL